MTNVLIYGAGAIGSFMGYLLSEIDRDNGRMIENVALLGKRSHIQTIKESGLRINFQEGSKLFRFQHCFQSLEDLRESEFSPSLIIVCVKTYSLSRVCNEIKASGMLMGKLKDATFILLMNGMGNRELFDMESCTVHEGITSIGVLFSEDGLIELKGQGKTVLEDVIEAGIKEFIEARFKEKRFEIEFASDFRNQQWNKLFANAVINPITAITREKNGIVLSMELEYVVEEIIEECLSVAKEEGYLFSKIHVLESVLSIASKTFMNTSSMLQDVSNRRRTEIESINGYVIRLANEHAIPVPVNKTLFALLRVME
ncbi:MAG: 2-dehydropantoate 2-reductase [Methanotrichaceae archaeon]|nr:2-dehydropantoate 2-reductase [Methanotrichaceae archaeon]